MGPFIRIALRYLAGGLVLRGVLSPETAQELSTDPDVIYIITQAVDWLMVVAGTALATVIEWAYQKAKQYGWAT
ncbi:hypothetical protein MXMO3_01835 [Maritalea myrionectae]|uniref:Uncharacterized protein n=1 Tax=Maritalea myrionectae TaxID=454601 RepID=A0A2R4MEC5_9HYPH|nr:hypothetical protein [Maritalea myrionectae]AVX04360.1 hypothetical protein MXMO3_01835 [Maritalea myrionectae]